MSEQIYGALNTKLPGNRPTGVRTQVNCFGGSYPSLLDDSPAPGAGFEPATSGLTCCKP